MSLQTIVDALDETLASVGAATLAPGPEESWDGSPVHSDVSARTDLGGGKATLVLTLSEDVALELVRAFGGIEVPFDDALVADVAAELLNITTGRAHKSGPDGFSIPVACRARDHEVPVSGDCRRVVSRYADGEIGLYFIEPAAA